MEPRASRGMTVEEYIALDRSSEDRWEYVDGEAYAMAGGSTPHALVTGNLFYELRRALEGKNCVPFNQAQKIATVRTSAFHYPDASVVCPPFAKDARDENAFTSPVALFEVLSPTTADYDRGEKFEVHYRSIDTLREYVLVNPERRRVEYRRVLDAERFSSLFIVAGALRMEVLGIEIPLDRLWTDLDRVRAP
ncbi:MAG: Uma2 family endonuclease [Labilithrix sp.]|nr:Uma2 family endonuclease [Labilithrix sp.]MCW5815682.1 Uma2 family endonuclease [Labilithrix sp.]